MIEQFLIRQSALGNVTNLLISAGTLSSNRSDVTFANSNGVSFGLNTNGVITASAAGGGGGAGTGFTTATTAGTNVVGTLSTNGLSMGVPAYLTTAALSQDSSKYAGTGFTTATTAGTNIVGTLNTAGISMGVPAYLTTAAQSGGTSNFAGTGFTSTSTAGSNIVGTLATNGLSVGIPNYLTTAMQSNAATISNINVSAGTTSTNASAFTFANANNVSFGLGTGASAGSITGSIATTYAGTGFTTATTAGTAIVGTLNTSGLSMGVPAFLTTAMQSNAATISNINISAGTTSTNASAFTFANANGVSFGLGTGASIGSITGSIATTYAGTGFTSTTTAGTAIVGTLNTSGLSLGVPAFLTTAEQSRQPMSYFANLVEFAGNNLTFAQSNSFYVVPLSIQEKISIGYLRIMGNPAFTSTTIATSAVNNATGASTAFSLTQAHNAVLYTVGTGASSRSLQYVYSSSAGFTWAASVSQASTSNASQQSITQAITFPSEGATTGSTTTQYSVSATNGPISTTQYSNFTGQRFLDIPFSTSLSAGNYWLALNRISGTVGGKNIDYAITSYADTQKGQTWGLLNVVAGVSNPGPQIGIGNWTTNAAQTTSSIAFVSISATSSYPMVFVQFINQS